MSQDLRAQMPAKTNIEKSAICGFWEVASISNNKEKEDHSSVTKRIKYHFLEEMIFIRIEDGNSSHGTWELSEKAFETKKQFSIILNGTFKYIIVNIDVDEMILSD